MQVSPCRIYRMRVVVGIAIALAQTNVCWSAPFSIATIFAKHKAIGTLVVERMSDGGQWRHNSDRARELFIPASTFKIPHALIALDTGVVPNVDKILKWDGKVRQIRSWNRSQSLRDAMKNSTVPIFQNIARKIGPAQMQRLVVNLNYGNRRVGKPVDKFWLEGPLRISALQQVDFLKRLYFRKLQVSKNAQNKTIEIMKRRQNADILQRGKTGHEIASNPGIGWYVGWWELPDDVYFFALNMDMTRPSHRRVRIGIVDDVLSYLIAR